MESAYPNAADAARCGAIGGSLGGQYDPHQYAKQRAYEAQAAYAQDTCAAEACGLVAFEQRFANAIKEMDILAGSLEEINCRLNGGANKVSGSTQSAPRPVPNGKIALFMQGMDELDSRISRAMSACSSLNRTI